MRKVPCVRRSMAAQIKDTCGAEYEQEQARQAEAGVVAAEEASAAAAEPEPHSPGAKGALISAAWQPNAEG